MKKFAAIVIVSFVHFVLCDLVNTAVLSDTAANVFEISMPFSSTLMLLVSKALYFPLLSLHLYSRNWFPGDLIIIVMAANSLVWGIGLVLGAIAVKNIAKKKPGWPSLPRTRSEINDKRK